MHLAKALIGGAAVAGFAAASAALYGRYRTLPQFLTGPNICRLDHGGCAVLFRTPQAALLGVPNALLGVLYYPALLAGLAVSVSPRLLLAVSLLPLALSAVLARILIRDRLECRICWVGHAANLAVSAGLAILSFGR